MQKFKIEVVVEGHDLRDQVFAAIAAIVGDDAKIVASSVGEPSLEEFTDEIRERLGLLRREAKDVATGNWD